MNVQVIHRGMGVHAYDDVFGPVPTGWEEGSLFFHWWWVARAHHFFQSLVVGFVRGDNVAILTSEFVGSEILESDDAFLYFGKEGGVCGQRVERMLIVIFGFSWNE